MPNEQSAKDAIKALNGTELGGRDITVNEARPRNPRGGPKMVTPVHGTPTD